MAWWIDLLLDMFAYVSGVCGWVCIVWLSISSLITLWVTGILAKYPTSFLVVIACPLAGLILLWFEKGLYARKLGRLILLVLASGSGLALCIWSAIRLSNLGTNVDSIEPGAQPMSPWALLFFGFAFIFGFAVGVAALAKRKELQEVSRDGH